MKIIYLLPISALEHRFGRLLIITLLYCGWSSLVEVIHPFNIKFYFVCRKLLDWDIWIISPLNLNLYFIQILSHDDKSNCFSVKYILKAAAYENHSLLYNWCSNSFGSLFYHNSLIKMNKQVYTNLEGDRSHVVNTSWAMLALIDAGQV